MSSGMRVSGLNEMAQRLRRLGDQASRSENEVLRAGAAPLQRTMSRNAPGPSKRRRQHLKDNIIIGPVRKRANEKVIQVGPGKDSFYSHFLEFGTTKMTPRPFVEPSVNEAGNDVLRAMAAQMRRELGL